MHPGIHHTKEKMDQNDISVAYLRKCYLTSDLNVFFKGI